MEKIILVDGNNLLFRSYYATAYNGNFMKNSKGFPTNALFGFVNMMNKIIEEEQPTRILVAFDKGKTFRHEKYDFYKGGRIETPEELKQQFPVAKELLGYMGIQYYEIDSYEADDIIGTFASYCDKDPNYVGTIISSDKDLLQLLSPQVDIKLLKQKDYIRYNPTTFQEAYGIEPIRMIDLKALMGDASDNIPGVKGIGEKTALKLLVQYETLDNLYAHIDEIKGSTHDKLVAGKEDAYMSYEIATIERNVPLEIHMEDILYREEDTEKLNALYEELEFYSFLKKREKKKVQEDTSYIVVEDGSKLDSIEECAIYLETTASNYHRTDILGMGVYDGKNAYYVPYSILKENPAFLSKAKKSTYDAKRVTVALKWHDILIDQIDYDTMIASYLLEYNQKEDIAYLANELGYSIPFKEELYDKKNGYDEKAIEQACIEKAKFIYETKKQLLDSLEKEELLKLFYEIEMPLSNVLATMEYNGIYVNKKTLQEMGEEIQIKIDLIKTTIYNYAGGEFNISSPIQLGEVLFEKLNLPHGKKGKNGYSTAADVLEKLKDKHPIIPEILEYRMLTKLYTTYIEGLIDMIMEDSKIHTIYTQTLTRTGRLSSIEPNLQNIPIRHEYGKLIRKAFVPSPHSLIVSSDYSQIELRILAHVAHIPGLIEAFQKGADIHSKTASDIFDVEEQEVTKDMRRVAKAVNFGIIYGISSYGLSENIGVTPKEAQAFIDNYMRNYPGVQNYMDETIQKAHQDGYVRTMFHRKRTIPELENKNYMIRQGAERMALNTPIQGTSADIIKKAMVDIDAAFQKEKIQSKMIVQVHDELVFDCLESEFEKVKEIVTECMENVFPLDVPLKVEIEYGSDWYQAK